MSQAEVGPGLLTFIEGCVYSAQKRRLRQDLESISQAGRFPLPARTFLLPEHFLDFTLPSLVGFCFQVLEKFSIFFFVFFAAWVIIRVQDTLEHCIVFIFFKLILTGYQVIFVIGSLRACCCVAKTNQTSEISLRMQDVSLSLSCLVTKAVFPFPLLSPCGASCNFICITSGHCPLWGRHTYSSHLP